MIVKKCSVISETTEETLLREIWFKVFRVLLYAEGCSDFMVATCEDTADAEMMYLTLRPSQAVRAFIVVKGVKLNADKSGG